MGTLYRPSLQVLQTKETKFITKQLYLVQYKLQFQLIHVLKSYCHWTVTGKPSLKLPVIIIQMHPQILWAVNNLTIYGISKARYNFKWLWFRYLLPIHQEKTTTVFYVDIIGIYYKYSYYLYCYLFVCHDNYFFHCWLISNNGI